MTLFMFICKGIYHDGNECKHGCIAITSSKSYPPINCLLFVQGYEYTKPNWKMTEERNK